MNKNALRKITGGSVALIILTSMFTNGAALAATTGGTPFVDVPADYDFREAIGFLKDKAIAQGYPDQTFKPEAAISRAEFLKMAMKLSGRSGTNTSGGVGSAASVGGAGAGANSTAKIIVSKSIFSDVHPDDWFYSDIVSAQKLGIVQGSGTGSGKAFAFLPNAQITRVQALKMAMNAFQFSPPAAVKNASDTVDNLPPPDVSSKAWYYSQVMTARRLNILTDNDAGNFSPDTAVTRGMAAEILFRVATSKQQQYAPIDITRGWVDIGKMLVGTGSGGNDPALSGISFKIPKTWIAVKDGSRITMVKKDPLLPIDFELVTPMSANVVINTSVLQTSALPDVYFEQIKSLNRQAFPGENVEFTAVVLMGQPALHVKVAARGIEHWYIYLPNKTVVTVYGQYGLSSLSLKMRESIRGIVRTLQMSGDHPVEGAALSAANQKLLSDTQSKVLMEKSGKSAIDALGDATILETDDIGVGTGPVDYYYSAKINLSLKYERVSDTILAVRSGKMSAF